MLQAVRLSKRVCEIARCSRAQAEQLIEGGWVRVDGVVVCAPGSKVSKESVAVDPQAAPAALVPATLLVHKPAGMDCEAAGAQLLVPQQQWKEDRSAIASPRGHLARQTCVAPLETQASGLIVFTQDARVRRKLLDESPLTENEWIVEVAGAVSAQALDLLNRSHAVAGRAMLPARVSVSRRNDATTGLRFAVKGWFGGQIAQTCQQCGLALLGMRRIRIGRVALGRLPPGQWRQRTLHERF